jgi:hypothetical protein
MAAGWERDLLTLCNQFRNTHRNWLWSVGKRNSRPRYSRGQLIPLLFFYLRSWKRISSLDAKIYMPLWLTATIATRTPQTTETSNIDVTLHDS